MVQYTCMQDGSKQEQGQSRIAQWGPFNSQCDDLLAFGNMPATKGKMAAREPPTAEPTTRAHRLESSCKLMQKHRKLTRIPLGVQLWE